MLKTSRRDLLPPPQSAWLLVTERTSHRIDLSALGLSLPDMSMYSRPLIEPIQGSNGDRLRHTSVLELSSIMRSNSVMGDDHISLTRNRYSPGPELCKYVIYHKIIVLYVIPLVKRKFNLILSKILATS